MTTNWSKTIELLYLFILLGKIGLIGPPGSPGDKGNSTILILKNVWF